MSRLVTVSDEVVINKIYHIRGKKVMLDRDLAELYRVSTSQLKRQVRRNANRFPDDFMFVMSTEEFRNWRCQIGISNLDKMGLRYAPFCFTEQGVAMLSSVLNSRTAIDVNIQIIRIFTRMREVLLTHKDILVKLEQVEKKMLKQDEKTRKQEEEIQTIFRALKGLLSQSDKPMRKIGFKRKTED